MKFISGFAALLFSLLSPTCAEHLRHAKPQDGGSKELEIRELRGGGKNKQKNKQKNRKSPTLSVTVTNLMEAQVLSPFFYVTHKCEINLFNVGEEASEELAILAEDGDPEPLFEAFEGSPYVCDLGFNDGPTGPGESVSFDIRVGSCDCWSTASMLIGTNDSFGAVNGAFIRPRSNGMYPAYDAGSEGNSELCIHIPGPPCAMDTGNTNAGNPEGFVHINRGISGDFDIPFTYDWRNPVIAVSSFLR